MLFFIITRSFFSLFGVTDSLRIEILNLVVSNGATNVYMFQYIDLQYPFQKQNVEVQFKCGNIF